MSTDATRLLVALGPLLRRALDLGPAERAAWLAELRGDRPELAGELEVLLAQEAALDASGFLQEGQYAGPPVPPLAGRRLGPYTLDRPIGKGGMGTVWLAHRSDGRYEGEVAVKLLNLALLDRVGIERFRREGSALARLDHPNIGRLLDAGIAEGATAGGQPYLVLEYVDGMRVDHYCDERRLGPLERLALFQQVLGAVAHAHANLIVHRDLKPSNILVTADGTAKLLDFGIAKLISDESGKAERTELTDVGGTPLTPDYAAPEQVTGGPITTATDVYALGVLLYLLLAGRHPTGAGRRSSAEVVQALVNTEPPRLSTAVSEAAGSAAEIAPARASSAARLRRLYLGDLDNIVAKALKKHPSERYVTVGAFAEDLRRYLHHEPVGARPDSVRYRVGKFIQRNGAAVALSAIAVVAVLVGLVGTITQAARATRYAARADSAARAATSERDFALHQLSRRVAIQDLTNFLISEVGPSGEPITAKRLLQRSEAIVEREHAYSPAERVEMLVAIGSDYWVSDQQSDAVRLLRSAHALSREVDDPSARAKAACALARAAISNGDGDRGEMLIREGIAELPDDARFHLDRLQCLLSGSWVARERGDGREAVARAEEAARLVRRLQFPAATLELEVQAHLATAYSLAGRLGEAATAFSLAHARLVGLGRGDTQAETTLLNNWGLTLQMIGQPIAAESLYRASIGISRSVDTNEAVSPVLLNNYARALAHLGRLEEASRYAEQAQAGAQRAGQNLVVLQALLVRATIYARMREFARAERMLARAGPLMARMLPPGHAGFASVLSLQALVSEGRGDLVRARAAADSAVRLVETTNPSANILPTLLLRRAELALAMGDRGVAERDAAAVLARMPKVIGAATRSEIVGAAYVMLGRALRVRGAAEDSRVALDSALVHLHASLGPTHQSTQDAAHLIGRQAAPSP